MKLGIKKIIFHDDTGHMDKVPAVGLWTEYTKTENGWETRYGAEGSAVPRCPVCGEFGWHGDKGSYSCGKTETISQVEMEEIVSDFTETPLRYMETFSEPAADENLAGDILRHMMGFAQRD